jgi:hypothetical protein
MYIAMSLTALTGAAFFFIAIFQCSPIDYWWKQIYTDVKGHCITIHAIMNITYAYSAVSILTDFTFALLPIHIVMGLQMDLKTKLVLVPIFAMATVASVACAIRIGYLPKFTEGDFLCEYPGSYTMQTPADRHKGTLRTLSSGPRLSRDSRLPPGT